MRAAQVTDYTLPPRLVQLPDPVPQPGEVLVHVEAAGIHQVVRMRARGGHYTNTGRVPFVPGVDGVGRLEDGRRVWFFTMGSETNGSMAEQVAMPADWVVEMPGSLDPVATAASVNPMMAAWMSLFVRGGLQPGQRVAVTGATGAAGRATLELARGVAGHATAIGRDATALAALVDEGLADEALVLGAGQADGFARLGAEVDVVVDYLWGPVAEALWAGLGHSRRPGHRLAHVEVGTMAGPDARLPGSALRSSDLAIIGSAPGAYSREDLLAQIPALLQRMDADRLQVAHRSFALSDLDAAWASTDAARSVLDMTR